MFRAVRDTLPNNPTAQERILGASFTALALADVSLNPPIRDHIQTDSGIRTGHTVSSPWSAIDA